MYAMTVSFTGRRARLAREHYKIHYTPAGKWYFGSVFAKYHIITNAL